MKYEVGEVVAECKVVYSTVYRTGLECQKHHQIFYFSTKYVYSMTVSGTSGCPRCRPVKMNGMLGVKTYPKKRSPEPVSDLGKEAVRLMLAGVGYTEAANRLGLKQSTTDKWYWRYVHPTLMQDEIDRLRLAKSGDFTPEEIGERIRDAVEGVNRAATVEIAALEKRVADLTRERDAWRYEAESRVGQKIEGVTA